jgi:16S rRNA (adenine1518-N6/adenine1519-N6)-dimethyltransferase
MSEKVKAKKHLGQHFLKDEVIADKIVEALQTQVSQIDVLEVGPGMGVLTQRLLNFPQLTVWASEIDKESVQYLQINFPALKERLLSQDFLEMDFGKSFKSEIAIIGNFPYNISSQIVFKILDNYERIPLMVGMFQKEVAERICAKPCGKAYGIISVLTQALYDASYLFTVPPHVFDPPPKVESGVMQMKRKSDAQNIPMPQLKKVVKTAFNQRRKKLRNAISIFGLTDEALGIYATKRAEELNLEDYLKLIQIIDEKGKWN